MKKYYFIHSAVLNALFKNLGVFVLVDKKYIASIIDHTMLKPEASKADIEKLCNEALKYGFASVCINPCYVKLASNLLLGSNVKVCTVVGFPLGANATETKVFEAKRAVEDGAKEVDMVINVGALKDKKYDYIEKEIGSIVDAVKDSAIVKVIIETCLLDDDEKIRACEIAKNAGASFVKTSTGFNKSGAKAEDVALMRKTVGESMGVKAAGGIRTYEDAAKMVEAGATRIGASASVKIVS